MLITAGIVLIALVVLGGAGLYLHDRYFSTPSQQSLSVVGNGGGAQEMQTTGNNCGTARTTTGKFSQQNGLNTTGNEGIDSTCYLYKVGADGSESFDQSITDTTAGTATLDCNQAYRMFCVSTDGNGGDSARVLSVVGDGVKVIDGKDEKGRDVPGQGIEFLTNAPTYSITWKGKQHGVLQFRAKDLMADQLMYDDADSSTQDYELDGVNFSSSVGNTTALAVGAGGKVNVRLEIQANETDVDFSDLGTYIAVKAATTVWDGTSVSAKFTNGAGSTSSPTNLKGNLDNDENLLLDTYQYVYFVPDSIRQDSSYFELSIKALSGVNPGVSDDIEIDFLSKGAVLRTAGESAGVKFSASTDASSRSAIFAVQDTNIAVS